MNLMHRAVSVAVWSLCAYTKAPETPKQMIRNLSEPACLVRIATVNTAVPSLGNTWLPLWDVLIFTPSR